jgi:hypothetical protein
MATARYELTTTECVQLLQGAAFGRLCVVDDGHPVAIPISYRLVRVEHGARFAIRTSPTTIVGRYEGPASLEVDDVSLLRGRAWSVIVRGALRKAHPNDELADPHPLVEEGRTQWMVLEPSAWSGRRFVVTTSNEGLVVDWQMAPASGCGGD